MLITCPYCGPRDLAEFSYQGDANGTRPDPTSQDARAWSDYVFQRTNAAGPHREYWQHAGGCRAHLVVVRDTTTHEIASVDFARSVVRSAQANPVTPARESEVPARRAKTSSKPATPTTRSRKKPT